MENGVIDGSRGFAGKTVLVTGGGSGIGATTALRLAESGAQVAVVDRDRAGAARVADAIAAKGGRALAIAADIADPAANDAMFVEATATLGPVRSCFLNAGILQNYCPFEALTVDEFDRVLAVNLRGAFLGIQAALRHLQGPGACVVTASAAAVTGFTDAAAYSASKHGVLGLVRSAALAFGQKDLRINALCPGGVTTPMTGGPQLTETTDPAALPLPDYRGLLGPQHIAETVLFLLSPAAIGMTGQAVLVDAGLMAAFPPVAL